MVKTSISCSGKIPVYIFIETYIHPYYYSYNIIIKPTEFLWYTDIERQIMVAIFLPVLKLLTNQIQSRYFQANIHTYNHKKNLEPQAIKNRKDEA